MPPNQPVALSLADTKLGSRIADNGSSISVPDGKYAVHYSFQGVGTDAGTLEITPFFNGASQSAAARKAVFTSAKQLGTIDGFFAFTANDGGTELKFDFSYLPEAQLVDSRFSVMIERKS